MDDGEFLVKGIASIKDNHRKQKKMADNFKPLKEIFMEFKADDKADDKADNTVDENVNEEQLDTTNMPDLESEES